MDLIPIKFGRSAESSGQPHRGYHTFCETL